MTGLAGRVAIVTGAASGMGRAHALRLAALGAAVALQDIDEVGLGETAGAIAADGGTAVACGFDIADVAAIDRMAQSLMGRFGRIDIVVNNAGIGIDRPIEAIDAAAFDRMIGIHVKGSFFCARAAVPAMKAQRWGRIVNISSRWAQAGHTLASDYIAAKAALLGLTKAWAKELAPWGITVNAIAPGGVWSRMVLETLGAEGVRREELEVPLGRWAQPEEIASSLAFLASEEAGFITGQVISPNGGKTVVGF
ncbi:SDR family NAD(P)-dependent oxidoreductase [Labrys wisconsinensis]|uniref:3-oxoacyl-[acyl-carrier protein] reductase n=1 Tax=Labrys wisconsinensis TaxID=425677 RepID=A0ABU0J299_9HYPH|nr:SDR family NAD(P)-dependent oxidoreductase [Labrys wisconsinensis]MDQ0468364.1 3-oxoacyl-[acyl-carrier protein] reductase [Labrys wisconsinensis]